MKLRDAGMGRGEAQDENHRTPDHHWSECEEIKYWDKISDTKLNPRKQLIVSLLKIYLDTERFDYFTSRLSIYQSQSPRTGEKKKKTVCSLLQEILVCFFPTYVRPSPGRVKQHPGNVQILQITEKMKKKTKQKKNRYTGNIFFQHLSVEIIFSMKSLVTRNPRLRSAFTANR